DTAAGYAALSLMPPRSGVLTTEFKINLLAPAVGDRIVARGKVVKAGRTLTLAQTEVFAETDGQEKLVALLTATLMTIEGRADVNDGGQRTTLSEEFETADEDVRDPGRSCRVHREGNRRKRLGGNR